MGRSDETPAPASSSRRTITALLVDWRDGDDAARDQMISLVYGELRRLASRFLRSERRDHTLQTTALVHEAYVRLVDADVPWVDRIHFYSVAARCMRRILVDHARAHRSGKRGGGVPRLPLEEALAVSREPSEVLLEVDDALAKLAAEDPAKGKMVELYYFGGLTQDEIAQGMGRTPKQVSRELRVALAWLRAAMSEPSGST